MKNIVILRGPSHYENGCFPWSYVVRMFYSQQYDIIIPYEYACCKEIRFSKDNIKYISSGYHKNFDIVYGDFKTRTERV